MRQVTLMIVPDGPQGTKQIRVPRLLFHAAALGFFGTVASLGYLILGYVELQSVRSSYQVLSNENDALKGEARLLVNNLEDVKRSLRQVQDYTEKLGGLTQLKVQTVSKKTGIGPLTREEYSSVREMQKNQVTASDYIPLGVNLDNLAFRPIFDRLTNIGDRANEQAIKMQKLLATLSQRKSLLSSIPSKSPVNGWIASGYGSRVSPFTGKKSLHRGIDIAAPIGTEIHAPADGVVIFNGAKAGFGNFIMIAHGYGVVSRYGHNHQNMVQAGQQVKRGDIIGTVGATGRTTGPHLHYEIWVNGKTENPRKFILNLSNSAH